MDIVRNLLVKNDILFLQETLIFSTDSDFVNRISPHFDSMIVSCTRKDGIDSGRPVGGLIVFWKRSLNTYIFPVAHQPEFCRIDLKVDNVIYSLFNVYLPCDNRSINSLVAFKEVLAQLSATLDGMPQSKIFIMGDFNSHPGRDQLV